MPFRRKKISVIGAGQVGATCALMLASRVFLHYFAVEVLFGVPNQFGQETSRTVSEISEILRKGMLASEGR